MSSNPIEIHLVTITVTTGPWRDPIPRGPFCLVNGQAELQRQLGLTEVTTCPELTE